MSSEDQEILAKISQLAGEFIATALFVIHTTHNGTLFHRANKSAQEWAIARSAIAVYSAIENQYRGQYVGYRSQKQIPH